MARYLVLLRGIAPSNPLMRNAALVPVFEGLGFDDVRTVTSSGNVLVSSDDRSARRLEDRIEEALAEHLGAPCAAIVRTVASLDRLLALDVFDGHDDGPSARCNVTFLKHPATAPAEPPDLGSGAEVVAVRDGAVFTVIDTTSSKTPEVMRTLERAYGKQVTMRTWKALHKIAAAARP